MSEQLREALKPFAKMADACEKMGGTFPKTGSIYSVNTGSPHGAEITREHLIAAREALVASDTDEEALRDLRERLGLLEISHNYKTALLESAEIALIETRAEAQRLQARIAELEAEIATPILCTVNRMADAIADMQALLTKQSAPKQRKTTIKKIAAEYIRWLDKPATEEELKAGRLFEYESLNKQTMSAAFLAGYRAAQPAPAMPCDACPDAELCAMGQPCPRHNEPQPEDEV